MACLAPLAMGLECLEGFLERLVYVKSTRDHRSGAQIVDAPKSRGCIVKGYVAPLAECFEARSRWYCGWVLLHQYTDESISAEALAS